MLKGRANYLCRRQLQGFQPFLLADGRDARAWEAMQGWLDATRWVILASIACYTVSFAVAFLMPKQAREDVLA